MGLLRDIVLTAVCTLGLAFLAWWLFGRLLRPIPSQRVQALIPGRGDGEDLEQAVRSFIWLRGLGLLDCTIVIADVNLSPKGWQVALRLTTRWSNVILWPATDLADYIARS